MGKVCQGLFLRLSENPILTGLAETRNGVFLFREGIRELSDHAETRGTGGFSYCAHTGHTTEKASEECLDFGGLGCCFSVVFHVPIIHIREAFSRQILVFFQISYGHKCLGIKDLRFGPRPFWQKSSTVSSFFLPPIPPQAKCSSLPRGGGRSGPKDYLYSPCRVGGIMLPCSGGSNRSGLRTGGS